MALIKCSECGKEISSEAKVCPHCGKPIGNHNEAIGYGKAVLIGIGVILMVIGFALAFSGGFSIGYGH